MYLSTAFTLENKSIEQVETNDIQDAGDQADQGNGARIVVGVEHVILQVGDVGVIVRKLCRVEPTNQAGKQANLHQRENVLKHEMERRPAPGALVQRDANFLNTVVKERPDEKRPADNHDGDGNVEEVLILNLRIRIRNEGHTLGL